LATSGHNLPVAIGQREDFDRDCIHALPAGVCCKQDRFASGQHLRIGESNFSSAQSRDSLGRAATGGNPQQTLPELADDDAAIRSPTRADKGAQDDVP